MSNELTNYNGGAVTVADEGRMGMAGPSAVAARGTSAVSANDAAAFNELAQANVVEARALPALRRWYGDYVTRLQADEDARDEADGDAGRQVLRSEWGASYAANVARIRQFVNTALPGPLADAIWNERDSNGHLLANNPVVLRFLLNEAQGGASNAGGIEREIAELEQLMRTNPRAYYRDEAKQKRLRELYAMRDR